MVNANTIGTGGVLEPLIEKVSGHDPECTEVAINSDHWATVTQDDLVRLVEALKGSPYVRDVDFLFVMPPIMGRRPTDPPAIDRELIFRRLSALLRVNTVIQRVRFPLYAGTENLSLVEESLCHGNNKTMTALDLYLSGIRGIEGGELIRRILLNNTTITYITFENCEYLDSECVARIARALRDDRCVLRKINFSGCRRVGNDGAVELSNALGNDHNASLEELRIGNTEITCVGARHILAMLETNTSLRVVVLEGNRLDADSEEDDDDTATIGELLPRVFRRNATLRELNFDWYEGVSATELRGIAEGLRDNESLVSIPTHHESRLQGGEEGSAAALWRTWSAFVTRRNKLRPLIVMEGNGHEEEGGRPAQSLLPYLLQWCNNGQNNGSLEGASLIHHVLCARSNDILEWVTTTTTKRSSLEA